jgi:hypothetical protein
VSTSTPAPDPEEETIRQVRMVATFNLTASVIASAVVAVEAELVADAALAIAVDEPNKAISVLIGSALEMTATGMSDHAWLSLQAAVHLLRSVAASQAEGITGVAP